MVRVTPFLCLVKEDTSLEGHAG